MHRSTFTRSLVCGMLTIAVLAIASGPASAADSTVRITGGAISSSLAAGTVSTSTAGGTHTDCTGKTSTATTGGSAAVSLNSVAYTGCQIRETGNTVSTTIFTTPACSWTLTMSTLTSGSITIPANCVTKSITLLSGNVCTISWGQVTVAVTWTNATKQLKYDNPNAVPTPAVGSRARRAALRHLRRPA